MHKEIKIQFLIAFSIVLIIALLVIVNKDNRGDNNVKLGQYKNITTGLSIETVAEDSIDQMIDEIVINKGGCYEEAKGSLADIGDKVEGIIQQNDAKETYPFSMTLGDESYPSEFTEALRRKGAGETVEVSVPKNNNSHEIDKYIITIDKVFISIPITDSYVISLGMQGVSTVEQLRSGIKDYLTEQNREAFIKSQQDAVAKTVVENASITNIPEELIDEYYELINKKVNALVEYYKEYSEEADKITALTVLENEMKENGFSGTVDEYIRWYAEKDAREYLIFKKIADKEGIEPSQDEIFSAIASDWTNSIDQYPTLNDYLKDCNKEAYERALVCSKVKDYLTENSKEVKEYQNMKVTSVTADTLDK